MEPTFTPYMTVESCDSAATDAKSNAVRMLINTPVNEGKVIVIVEGVDDKRVFRPMFKSEATEFYADGNCDKHAMILRNLNPRYENRIIAIKDADFDHLKSCKPPYSNMFLTDDHDMEGMVLHHGIPQCVKDAYPGRFVDITVEDICEDLREVSYLRYMNDVQHLGMNFKSQTWSTHYAAPYTINIESYLSAVIAAGKTATATTKTDLDNFITVIGTQDVHQLTRGHDLLHCLYIRAKDKNSTNFPQKRFFAAVRHSYTLDTFAKTKLYADINSHNGNLLRS